MATAHRDPNAGAPMPTGGDPIGCTFAVDRQIKGAVAPFQEVSTARSEATCGFTFEEGVRYRAFATYNGATLVTGLGSGTRVAPIVTSTSTSTSTTAPPSPTRPARPATPSPPRRIALTG